MSKIVDDDKKIIYIRANDCSTCLYENLSCNMPLYEITSCITEDDFFRAIENDSNLCPMHQEDYDYLSVMTKAIENSSEEEIMSFYKSIINSWQYEAAQRRKS